jgi:hypothetical protein
MFPDDEPRAIQEVICRLMEYLIENPDARDTLEGIERWWLGAGAPVPHHSSVERAVGALLAAGWMNTLADARVVYQVSELGLRAGKAYLNQIHQNLD